MSSKNPARNVFVAPRRFAVAAVSLLALAACEGGPNMAFLKRGDADTPEVTSADAGVANLVERDVEAPEVFEAKEAGLWDGRPSLGGVWAAHPDVTDPERVIIRNEANGKYVIGALFRKERETPGPKLQISSDAANELGLLAGSPTNLYVVALRRETVADTPILTEEPVTDGFAAPAEIAAASLDGDATAPMGSAFDTGTDTVAMAAAALDAPAPSTAPQPEVQLAAAVEPAPAPVPSPASKLDKPYLQIGIFSVEQNAQNTAQVMRGTGIVPTVLEQSSSGKTFWRVIIGPAQTKNEQKALLETVRGKGFKDAYAVTN